MNLYTIYRIYGDFRMHTKFYEEGDEVDEQHSVKCSSYGCNGK